MPFGGAFRKQNANSSGNPKPIPLLGNVVVPGFLPPPKTRSVSQFSIPLFQVYTTVEKMADERDVVHHFQNISFREPYMDYSLEELRLADYLSLKPSAPSSGDTPANTPSSEQSKPSATFGNSRVDASGKDTGEDHSSVKARSESISAWERQMETVMQRSPTASSFASETTTRHNASDLPSFLKISSVDGEDFGTSDASSGAFPTPSSTTPASSGTTSRGPGTSSIMASSANQTPSGNNGGTSGASPNAMSGANGPAMTFSERVSRNFNNAADQDACYQSITFTQKYSAFSLEELRLADYLKPSAMLSSSTSSIVNAASSGNSGGEFGSLAPPDPNTVPSGNTFPVARCGFGLGDSASTSGVFSRDRGGFGKGFGQGGLFGGQVGFGMGNGAGNKPSSTIVSGAPHSSAAPRVPEEPRKESDHNASSSPTDSQVASSRFKPRTKEQQK
ncbi:hypothetical protein IWZ00DRAFT_548026 [Phyllosticta capitalensis]